MTVRLVKKTPDLSSRIERLLEKMRPEELATRLKISVATIYRWKTSPPKRPLRAFLEALDELEKSVP